MTVRLDNIKVYYPGVRALDGVSLDVVPGQIHGIIGENGAGKSTLMNVLSGVVRPTSGRILLDGAEVVFERPAASVAHGISLVSQEGSLVPHLSAAENICLGFEPARFGMVIQRRQVRADAGKLLARWFPETRIDLDVPVGELPYAHQKIVEILRALHSHPKVLILDEPTATLPAKEKENLWNLIRRVTDQGLAVILISHFLTEVLELCQHLTALQDGRVVRSLRNEGLTERDLVGMMFNRTVRYAGSTQASRDEADDDRPLGGTVLEARDWSGPGFAVERFVLRKGEIAGLIGLTGSGHFEFARSLYEPAGAAGEIEVNGRSLKGAGIRRMKRAGVALVPDHRMINALISEWSVRENLSLINIGRIASALLGRVQGGAEHIEAGAVCDRLGIKVSSVDQKVIELSGGNKQKVSIGRWLFAAADHASVLVFIEPTEGVDVGAKQEIHSLIRALARQGAAVVVASSDLKEIASVVDRVMPFVGGRAGSWIEKAEFDEHRFIDAIVGVAA